MKIGNIEIRVMRQHRSMLPRIAGDTPLSGVATGESQDYTGALAVPDTTPWWKAVHQIIDEAEAETILSARKRIGETNKCIADVGAGEGVDLVRIKLKEAREVALMRER